MASRPPGAGVDVGRVIAGLRDLVARVIDRLLDVVGLVDITPNGVLSPGSRQDYLWLRAQEWWEELLIDTRCIRFWSIAPRFRGTSPTTRSARRRRARLEALRLRNLDAQIRAANADGLEVILLPYRYPLAANGTLSLPVENRLFEPENRAGGNGYLSWFYDRTQAAPTLKDLHYRLPPDGHGPDSQWGRFVGAMFERWVASSDVHGRADVIDVCNEPNGQLWPQRGPAANTSTLEGRFEVSPVPPYPVRLPPTSEMTVQKAVAEMMQTVDAYARSYSPARALLRAVHADSDVTANGSFRLTSKFAATPYSATPSDAFAPRCWTSSTASASRAATTGAGRFTTTTTGSAGRTGPRTCGRCSPDAGAGGPTTRARCSRRPRAGAAWCA